MGLYENVKEAAKMKGYSINKLEQELGFSRSYIGKFKTITPSADKIQKIADFLNVSANYLITGESSPQTIRTCSDCGLSYATDYADDVMLHEEMHRNWEMAAKKFGKLYCSSEENEKIKSENRNIRDNISNSIEKRYNAELEVLRCLYSRSVKASGYNLQHVTFDAYVAMMMYGKGYRKNLDDELYQKIVDNFGTKPGIKDGESIYRVPKKSVELNEKDNRDISKDIDSIMSKLELKEYGPAAYDGEDLSEESVALFKEELEFALRRLKLINKEKYNPNKNKK